MDRRVPFFLVAAAACFLLVLPSPEEFRKLAGGVGVIYLVLAVVCFLDDRSRANGPDVTE